MLNFKMHVFYIQIQGIYVTQLQEVGCEECECLEHKAD